MTQRIGIYVYDQVEVLDFAGPYEVFTTASRVYAREHLSEAQLFEVVTIGATSAPVHARAGLKIEPDCTLANHPQLDCVVLPGGVVTAELERGELTSWIRQHLARGVLTTSVCTGAFLLARAGVLDGHEVTTHWDDVAALREGYPRVKVREDVRWVDLGQIVTSAGISAGIDMSLHLVERLHNRQLAERTARQLDFEWTQVAA